MKRFISMIVAFSFLATTPAQVYGANYSDAYILKDEVQGTFNGHKDGRSLNIELQYVDLKSDYGFDIAKLGALNLLKGYERNFNPSNTATNLDVLSILLNMEGYEPEAVTLAIDFQGDYPELNSLECKNAAYIELAATYGYITEIEALDALDNYGVAGFQNLGNNVAPKNQENPNNENFDIKGYTTRVNLAEWMGIYLDNTEAALPITPNIGQYSVTDHTSILAYQIPYVETVVANGLMTSTNNQFRPSGTMTKGELAHTLVSLEPYYSADRGFETITGVVGAVKTNENPTLNNTVYDVYVRGTDGKTYVLSTTKYTTTTGTSTEIPTYKNGKMINNFSVDVNDTIEFVVATGQDPTFAAGTAMFTGVLTSNEVNYTIGKLKSVDLDSGTISIAPDDSNNDFQRTYQMVDGLYNTSGLVLGVGTQYERYAPDEIPHGAKYKLTLKGDVVTNILYIGQDVLIDERRGIVIENQPDFGYMVVLGMDNVKRVYKYYPDEITVEKQPYYDHEDYVGYYDEVFSYDGYDPRDATVYDIEAGDLIFLRPDSEDNTYIDYISVTPNYIQRTGVVNKVTVNDGYSTVLITFDNGQIGSYQVSDDVIVMKDRSIKDASYLEAGDNAKFLINEAIIDSGYVVESIKEISVEERGHDISSIVKGQFTAYNAIQGEVSLTNAQALQNSGWGNADYMATYSLKPNDNIDVNINDVQTTVTNFNRLLKNNDDYVTYMAVEQNYSGEKVKFITAYDGRDTLLATDMITNISANGKIVLQSAANEYQIKEDAIIVKNDKLVSKSALEPYDLVQVALNGGQASVIKVIESIENTGVQIARGRIQSVDEGNSFTVKSLVLLENNQWTYSPIERTYAVGPNTIYLTADGSVQDINTFIGYTQDTVINKVYNIIADGTNATFIIESPYSNENVNGTVYNVEDGVVYLKDVNYYDKDTGSWKVVGVKDNTATVNFEPNSVTIKNSEVVDVSKIQVGDKLVVKTATLDLTDEQSLTVTGYINFIEN